MYLGAQLTGSAAVGTFLGKLAADIAFYLVAIIGYELRKKLFSD